jgi:hypothetical protein
MSTYVFEQQWTRERDRLRSLESTFHTNTSRLLDERGVTTGWQCLEVGAGAGAVAWWLSDRVGPTGHVIGWLLVEDAYFGGPMSAVMAAYAAPAELAANYQRTCDAIAKIFAAAGADATFAPSLPSLLLDAGLDDVGGQMYAPVRRGGAQADWVRLTLEHLRGPLVDYGLLGADEINRELAMFTADSCYLTPAMVSAWGRRPTS